MIDLLLQVVICARHPLSLFSQLLYLLWWMLLPVAWLLLLPLILVLAVSQPGPYWSVVREMLIDVFGWWKKRGLWLIPRGELAFLRAPTAPNKESTFEN